MIINQAKFVISNTDPEKCPAPNLPEYAFTGRSNVGKSSLINLLTNNKKLAKTSVKPGKTRLINHFLMDEAWYLVDLPGYGYASVSKSEIKKWEVFIQKYLKLRTNLLCVFVLVDSRHEPLENDLSFMRWLALNQVPFAMVFTKVDKLSQSELAINRNSYTNKMLEEWEELPPIFSTSSVKKKGDRNLLQFIDETNKLF